MNLTSFSERLLKSLRQFKSASRGNVIATFALATIPIVGFVGSAVDYSRANSTRAALQSALDSVALMLAKNAATMTNAQLNAQGLAYLKALYTRPEAQNVSIKVTYSNVNGSSLKVDGNTTMNTNFVGIIGYNQLPIAASATTAWGTSRLRVALVLDVSLSMASSNKMNGLKTAAKNLLKTLQEASPNTGDVQVAIIPFNTHVNVGSGYSNASWVDWEDWNAVNGSCSKKDNQNRTITSKSACEASNVKGKWTSSSKNNWNGCITDRDREYDVLNTAPTNAATRFPADQLSSCPTAILPMTSNWTALKNKVDALTPTGMTNQPIGLVWGWHVLSTTDPLPSPALLPETTSVIILLSDGENTQNRWWTDEKKIDDREKLVCRNIKNADILVYSILVMNGNETLMRDCASKDDMFFKLTNANQIVTTFDAIGTSLARLRVAK